MKTEEALDKFVRLHEVLSKQVTELAQLVLENAKLTYDIQVKLATLEDKVNEYLKKDLYNQ